MGPQIAIDRTWLAEFCRRWRIKELSLFGSVLSEGFAPDSDVDVLITLSADAEWSLSDWVEMIAELEQAFGRPVDLVESGGLRNPYRRRAILATREVLYAT
jgi:predicted nucleotidyltransferase